MRSTVIFLGASLVLCLGIVTWVMATGAEAHDFSGSIEEDRHVFFDITVETTSKDIEGKVEWDDEDYYIDPHVYTPGGYSGDAVYYPEATSCEFWGATPYVYGIYTLDIEGNNVDGTMNFEGECSYPLKRSSYALEGSIAQDEDLTYTFEVDRADKALLLFLYWYEHPDQMYLTLYDGSDIPVTPSRDYTESDNHHYYYDIEATGTYKVVVSGSEVVSGSKAKFVIDSNVRIPPGEEYGEKGGILGSGGGSALVIGILVVIVIVVLFVVVRRRRSRSETGEGPKPQPWQPGQQQPIQQPPAQLMQQPPPQPMQPATPPPMQQPLQTPSAPPVVAVPQQQTATSMVQTSAQQQPAAPQQTASGPAGGLCTKCGTALKPTAKFCPECGTQQDS